MSETQKKPTSPSIQQHVVKTGLLSGLLNGCVMFLIVGMALGIGLWLDAALGSGKRLYTFAFVLGSLPISLVVVFFLGRWFSARMPPPDGEQHPEQDN